MTFRRSRVSLSTSLPSRTFKSFTWLITNRLPDSSARSSSSPFTCEAEIDAFIASDTRAGEL